MGVRRLSFNLFIRKQKQQIDHPEGGRQEAELRDNLKRLGGMPPFQRLISSLSEAMTQNPLQYNIEAYDNPVGECYTVQNHLMNLKLFLDSEESIKLTSDERDSVRDKLHMLLFLRKNSPAEALLRQADSRLDSSPPLESPT